MEKPTQGGVYIRDPETGALAAVSLDPKIYPPSPDEAQPLSPETDRPTSPANAGLVTSERKKSASDTQ